jgi:hypothetical protein
VARKQIELATCGLRQITAKLWKFFVISVDLNVGSVGSTDNIQTIFELLPCSVEHIGWNSRDHIPDTGIQFTKSVNWCSEHNALDITPQQKNPAVLCLVNGVFENPEWTLWTPCIIFM